MTIAELLKAEQAQRKAGKWLMGYFWVLNDHGVNVKVGIKSFGMYNQLLTLNEETVNRCSGHTISKVGEMRKFLTEVINSVVG